jgi:regulator of sigma E protease
MIETFIYTILAILGLSFLIFIHELGHYWMARRVGMRVEVFSIGFGKPIYSWVRNGVTWKLGWLLFGGYVKIAGTNTEKDEDPYAIPDGFFGKKPFDRMKVAFMGPFVNLLFAVLVFTSLWAMGGRDKTFGEYTNVIGWLDPKSELYAQGIRPGDEIISYNDKPYNDQNDSIYSLLTAGDEVSVKGNKLNYLTGEKTPFDINVKLYPNPRIFDKKIKTAGIIEPGRYIIYDKTMGGHENPLPENSTLAKSGLQYGDRVLWADGETVFSRQHLSNILNDGRVLVTIKRGDKTLLRRVPRVHVEELRPNADFREELVDWQYEANLSNIKFEDLYAIPYNLTYDCTVEETLKFIDKEKEAEIFPDHPYSDMEAPLEVGDKIIAVQGIPINQAFELLTQLQVKKVNIVVQRDPKAIEKLTSTDLEGRFMENVSFENLGKIAKSVGTTNQVSNVGNLYLLSPVTPIKMTEAPVTEEQKAWLVTELKQKRQKLESIEDPEKKAFELNRFDRELRDVVLGIPNLQDRHVTYNPKPTELFKHLTTQMYRTMSAMFSGSLSPAYLTGPIGIVRVVQGSSMVSLKEALFWLGTISLNLGFLNLLPFPVLDGGTILLSFFEMVTGIRVKPKVLESIVLVFAAILISFFLFITYNDVLRLFG